MAGSKILEVVGFDLGHGETSAARALMASKDEPVNLEINGEKNQVTAVAVGASGQIFVGDAAFNRDNVKTLNVTFKGRPNDQNSDLIKDFMRGCFRKLVDDKLVFGDDRTHFYVGCPSGWIKEEGVRESYERLLRETGITALTVEAESRAAFMQAKESGDLKLNMDQLKGTVLIIDIGSSTTDFTVVVNLRVSPIPDDGADLGAALIDKLIVSRAIAASPDPERARDLIESHQPHRARCELACRKAKETYFKDQVFHDENPDKIIDIIVRFDQKSKLELELTGAVMREILNAPLPSQDGKSWTQAYRQLLQSIRERMSAQKLTPKLVLMTGGASKMPFARSVCQEIFPSAAIKSEPNPEFSVSRGLARVGRADTRARAFLDDIDEFCNADQFPRLIAGQIPKLFDAIAEPLADGLIENAIKPGLRDWRDGKVKTLDDLQSEPSTGGTTRKIGYIERLAEVWMASPAAKAELEIKTRDWLLGIQSVLQSRTDEIANQHKFPKGIVRLTFPLKLAFDTSGVGPGNDATGVMAIGDAVALVVSIIVGAIVGKVLLIALIDPTGVSAIIAAVAAFFGWVGMRPQVEEWVKEANLWGAARKVALSDDKIKKICDDQRPNIVMTIREQLRSKPTESDRIIESVRGQFRSIVRDAARDATLLLS
jgi:hypothetical protein